VLIDQVLTRGPGPDSSAVVNHHKRVAYTAKCRAEHVGLPQRQQNELVMIGVFVILELFPLKKDWML